MTSEILLLEEEATLRVEDRPPAYVDRPLQIPEGLSSVTVRLVYEKITDRFQLYAALLDPHGLLRGHVQCPGPAGPRDLRLTVAEDHASPGCIPGVIEAGSWTLRIDLDRFRETGNYKISVVGTLSDAETAAPEIPPLDAGRAASVLLAQGSGEEAPQWLRGELHSHSVHSDGRDTVRDMLREVQRLGLDFWALSDHFTWSHWLELAELAGAGTADDVLLLPSIEVTTHEGHANVHGCTTWPDVYVDGQSSASALADHIHADAGLVCVNHPFSGPQAWRRADIEWSQVDAMEVVNHGQFANNDAAIGLWDRLLAEGHDIAPVAGTDCHSIGDPQQKLGELVTFIRVDERSVSGIIDGIRASRTVVSAGSFLDLELSGGFGVAELGSRITITPDEPVQVSVAVDSNRAGTVFILRDGLLWHTCEVDAGQRHVRVIDERPVSGAYRAEFHLNSDDPRYDASCLRSHTSFEALTSFIRVDVTEPTANPATQGATS